MLYKYNMNGSGFTLIKKTTFFLLFFIAGIFALVAAQQFLAPILFAALLSYLLFPIANFLERHGFPRILANLLSILTGVVVISGIIFFLSQQFYGFAQDFDNIKAQAEENLSVFEGWVSSTFGVSENKVRAWLEERSAELMEMEGMLSKAFAATSNTVLIVGLMPVYVFFMLYNRSKIYEVILRMSPKDTNERTKKILERVNHVATNYMGGLFVVVLILAILNSIGLWIVGIKHPIFFGIASALFNFIPYFGTLLGAILPLAFALLAMDSLSYAMGVIIYFVIIQFVENNILTPTITGGSVRLNPFVTILSLVAGSMIWGVAGMFMVVPFLAMFKILCEYIDFLKPIAFLLSDKGNEEYAMSMDKIKSLFKRKEK